MDLLFLGLSVIVGDVMSVPKACIDCKFLEGKIYGGNLLVCGMHPYGPSDDACDDFEKGDTFFSVLGLLGELRVRAREYLEEFHPQYDKYVLAGHSRFDVTQVTLDIELILKHRRVPQIRFGTVKDVSEWRSLKESGTLKAWIERWLEGEILARSEPVESNRPGGEEEAFWQDIRSALALCFPGSGEWSCRKVQREFLPSHLYEFETRSPSGEIVRFRVSARSVFSQVDLLRELIRGIRETAERTQITGQFPFLFEDVATETEDEEEWLYSRLHIVLRRCFPWSERGDIRKTLMLAGSDFEEEAFEFTVRPAQFLIVCYGRGSKEEKLESLSRKIYEQSERMRDRPQFRHLFEPPRGGRILPTGNYTPQNCRCIPESRERTS